MSLLASFQSFVRSNAQDPGPVESKHVRIHGTLTCEA